MMLALPEVLRFLEIPDTVAANMRLTIYGALIVLSMRYRLRGSWGSTGRAC